MSGSGVRSTQSYSMAWQTNIRSNGSRCSARRKRKPVHLAPTGLPDSTHRAVRIAARLTVRLYTGWHASGNCLPSVLAVNPEVMVERHHHTGWVSLGHRHEAGIGKRHGDGCISKKQLRNCRYPFFQVKGNRDNPANQQLHDSLAPSRRPPKQETGFGQHCLTCQERRFQSGPLSHRPLMMPVTAIEKRDQRAGIQQDRRRHHLTPARLRLGGRPNCFR